MRISGLWPWPSSFQKVNLARAIFPVCQASLPQAMPAGQGCKGRGMAQQLSVEAAPLEWSMHEKFLTTELLLAAAR